MSFLELLFALLLVAVVAGTATVAVLVTSLLRRAESQEAGLSDLRAQLAAGGQDQDSATADVRERLARTQEAVEGFRSALAARQQVDDEALRSLRRLESVIAGSSTRGAAGENILEEAIRHLPADMLQRNAWVGGKVVEFAIRLPGGKLLPIDSKWTATPGLEALAEPDLEPPRRAQLVAQVEKEVERRIREVSQYIDPSCTTPWALAAIPDAAYSICRSAFAEAHRRHVIIVGYSMALPYVLALYQLYMQFARTVDMENLQACLMDVDRQLDALEGVLENRIQRAVVMLGNAYSEGKQISARIRAQAQSIQVLERVEEGLPGPGLALVAGAEEQH
jgi:DNA recombination protein RmuC